MNRNMAAALAYADREWKVFPLSPNTKRPLTRHGFKEATDNKDTINAWWTEHPDAGVGLATGEASGLLVIDVDPRNNGTLSFTALLESLGPLPVTLESKTGGGGRHLFFQCKNGVPSKKGWAPGVDIKAKGGYVCVPFTRHPSGTIYAWSKGCNPDAIEAAQLPENWSTAIYGRDSSSNASVNPGVEQSSNRESGQVIADGQRHDQLLSLAGAMRRHGASVTEIEAALVSANETRCSPPLPEKEVKYLSRSLDRYQQGKYLRPLRTTHSVTARATNEPKEVDWLLDERIAMGDVALLVGPPESGKSWLFLDLAVCVALGLPAFGHFPTCKGRVLVIDEENTQDEIDRRLWNLVKAHGANPKDLTDQLFMPDTCQGFSFRDAASVRALHQAIATCKPDLILIDSLVAVSTIRDEASATEVRHFFHDKVYPLRSQFNSTIVLAHHTNKAVFATERPTQGMGLIRGSIDFSAAVDSILLLDTNGKGLSMSSIKVRRGPKPKPLSVAIVNEKPGVRPLVMNPPPVDINKTKAHTARRVILSVLENMGVPLGGRELLGLVRDQFPAGDGSTLRVVLNQLRKEGQVSSERRNGSVVYWKTFP